LVCGLRCKDCLQQIVGVLLLYREFMSYERMVCCVSFDYRLLITHAEHCTMYRVLVSIRHEYAGPIVFCTVFFVTLVREID
jgi:hypothetical protein